ncbi:response regulator [Streptomyces sp. NPDC051162]|uniref:response regulator n=1 Tax=Streptomyces sp. NPDC051162 TaxID=3154747 RepID=UPI00342CBEC6
MAFAACAFFALRGAIVRNVVPRMTAVRAMGVEVELVAELLDRAADERRAPVTSAARRTTLGRLEHAAEFLRGGRVLWVDDRPAGNTALVELFRSVGMRVDLALNTDDAVLRTRHGQYDLIISDVDRDGDPRAGLSMLSDLERHHVDVPVLIYAGNFDPERGVDRRIFAATTAPFELVNYVIDLMERARLRSL